MAVRYGMEEAVFLDALMFWYRTNRGDNRNFRDGRWWSHNSVKAYEQVFPWWSAKQIRRIIESCKSQGALLSGNYNRDQRDRTFWYTPSDDLLSLYGEDVTGNCNLPNGQMQEPEQEDTSAQTGEPLPCNTHVVTDYVPPIAPQGGAVCQWQAPSADRGGSRDPACKKLKANKYALQEDAKPLLREYVGTDRELHQALADFILIRQELRAINSRRAIAMLLHELDELSGGNRETKLQLIRQSCANSWKSVFPLKGPRASPPSSTGWAPDPEVY